LLNIFLSSAKIGSMPNEPRDSNRIMLSDPRAIRALAHPARLAIIEALVPGEELTATELAAVTGLSPSATSYHLKALAKWGIVETGQPRADGRDRPWKATGRSVELSSPVPGSTAPAEIAIMGTFLDRTREIATEFLTRQADEPPEWRDVVELASIDYWMTADEAAKTAQALREVLAPYAQRRRDARPAGSRRVRITRIVAPRAEPGGSAHPSGEPG
jgi:DNA-binding transcriptional ArsR family regulator